MTEKQPPESALEIHQPHRELVSNFLSNLPDTDQAATVDCLLWIERKIGTHPDQIQRIFGWR